MSLLGILGLGFGPATTEVEVVGDPPPPATCDGAPQALRDMMDCDVSNVFLNSDALDNGFAESVDYTPTGGSNRVIVVAIEEDIEPDFDATGDEQTEETIHVFVERHATRGIDDPQVGDKLARAGESSRPYWYSGEIKGKTRTAWTLIFRRYQDTGRGPAHPPSPKYGVAPV